MAKQLNLLNVGQVIPTAINEEMERSYLEYAMSVIVGRALPDVRDGLKPVHRRILYAMHELGLTPDRPYRKCARVVGDVLGKYHPHGDQAVYDALVRLVQDFSTRYPLLAGHGNFGSVDDDPPAAMRYTETRLAAISHTALLQEVSEATVDFTANFDNSQQEPVVLPAQLPILLLNGCTGIAVGMATNIPPHNLGEIVDGLVALIDHPDLPDQQLWQLIPGPDFPTGGEIIDPSGVYEAYATGRGSFGLRGIAQPETIEGGGGRRRREAIVITELPYQVNKAAWIEKLAELVNNGKIEGISDVRDESDRSGMRIVVELKRDTDPQVILEHLYRQTSLAINFGAIMLTLVDRQPQQINLRTILSEFLKFRETTLRRQYSHELEQASSRLHLVEGLRRALAELDVVIEILRHAPDGSTAKLSLIDRLQLSDRQADAILAMPLRRLTGLEQQNLETEYSQLQGQIAQLNLLLQERRELLKALKRDLRTLKKRFGDARRTRIHRDPAPVQTSSTPPPAKKTSPKPPTQVVIEFTPHGHAQRQKTGSSGEIIQTWQATNQKDLLVVTDAGRAYPVRVQDIPPAAGLKHGLPLTSLLSGSAKEEGLVGYFLDWSEQLLLLTFQGILKCLDTGELGEITSRGLTLIKLKEGDRLSLLAPHQPGNQILAATSGGRLLRWEEAPSPTSRTSQGQTATRIRPPERFVSLLSLKPMSEVLLVTSLGYGKRLPINLLRAVQRGELGSQALQFTNKTDTLVGVVSSTADALLWTSGDRILRVSPYQAPLLGKDGTGDKLVDLNPNEQIRKIFLADGPASN